MRLGKKKILNLDKLLVNTGPYDCVDTEIGKLCLFGINVGSQIEMYDKLGNPLKDCSPEEFVRILSIFICFPEEQLKDGKYKPDSPILGMEDVKSLSVYDLENISEVYVRNNEYLYKKMVFMEKVNDRGEIEDQPDFSDVEYPKKDSEDYTAYLHRLFIIEEEKQRQNIAGLAEAASAFSSGLADSIKNTFSLGASLNQTIESIIPASISESAFQSIYSVEPEMPKLQGVFEYEKRKEENRIKPFNQLGERLDQLIDSSKRTAKFMTEANTLQTIIAGEIKTSGDITKKFSKLNIFITLAVVLLTVIGLMLSAYSIYKDGNDIVSQGSIIQGNVDTLSQKLTNINTSIENGNQSVKNYQELFNKQRLIIEELRSSNNDQKSKIEALELRLLKMEESIKLNSLNDNKNSLTK